MLDLELPKNAVSGSGLRAVGDRSSRHELTLSIGVNKVKKWRENRKITPPQEMPLEHQSQRSNESTDGEIEAMLIAQIGQLLTQVSFVVQFVTLLELAAQSSWGTPVMEEVLSYALWAMVNHSMSTSDQLRTLMSTLTPSRWTIASNFEVYSTLDTIDVLLADILNDQFV